MDKRTERLYVVVVYDVAKGDFELKEKRQLYRKLDNMGRRVQYSAFEFCLTPPQKGSLVSVINRYIKEDERVSIYTLCDNCRKRIKRSWTAPRYLPIFDFVSG